MLYHITEGLRGDPWRGEVGEIVWNLYPWLNGMLIGIHY